MAVKKTSIQVQDQNQPFLYNEKEIIDHTPIVLESDWVLPGSMGVLTAGGYFKKASCGWYWPFTKEEDKLHFLVSPSVLDTLKTIKHTQQ